LKELILMSRRLTSVLLLALTGAVLVGCSSSSTNSSNTTKITETPTKIEKGKHRGEGPTESTKVP
jgi:hypothetical protein